MNLKDKLYDMQTKKLAYIRLKSALDPLEETCFADERYENAIQVALVRHVDRNTKLFYGRVPSLYYIDPPPKEALASIDVVRLIPRDLHWHTSSILSLVEIQGLLKGFGFESSIVDVDRNVPEEFLNVVDMWPQSTFGNEMYEVRKAQIERFWAEHPKLSKTFKALKIDF